MDRGEAAPDREPVAALIEDYLTGRIDEPRLSELEARLRDDPEARREFVRYSRLHTDLHFELRAREASGRVLDAIDRETPPPATEPVPPRRPLPRRVLPFAALAAGLLVVTAVGWWSLGRSGGAEVAWLVNAQDCTWAGGEAPTDLRPGKVLVIEHGLAEFRFQCGARVIVEGPAELELVSGTSARLRRGRLTARAEGVSGFEVLSPQGKVVDLGTEFGVAVSPQGATSVRVFEGRVEVTPAGSTPAAAVSLTRDQSARIADGKVTVKPVAEADPGRFVRSLAPAPVLTPRSIEVTFDGRATAGVRDSSGLPTGLTHRLPGTGANLPDSDPNLWLVPEKGQLELTTTDSDLNTRYQLERGEYLGLRLADLGFTGREDFELSATFPAIPALDGIGQLGLYAGSRNDRNVRGGVIVSRNKVGQYTQFWVNNPDGFDTGRQNIGVLADGTDLRLTLRRVGGKFSLTIEKSKDGFATVLTPPKPTAFLDAEPDLYVGVFGANAQGKLQGTLVVKEFKATVWVAAPAAGN